MTKTFCDRCGNEVVDKAYARLVLVLMAAGGRDGEQRKQIDACFACQRAIERAFEPRPLAAPEAGR